MIVEDFVMLGKTVPEPQSDGRTFVCSAGWSQEMRQLLRIYPLAIGGAPRTWDVCSVALERNPRDHRDESWQLRGDRKGGHQQINACFDYQRQLTDGERDNLLSQIDIAASKKEVNRQRQSLAIVQPDYAPTLCYSENVEADGHPQISLFAKTEEEKRQLGAKRFPFQPRLQVYINGKPEDWQLREWGCYEWLRKGGPDARHNHPIANRLKANPRLLIGNMNRHRNVWLVIAVLRCVPQGDLLISA